MKPRQEAPGDTAASPSPSFFQRTSAALHPRAFFRLSNLSAVSRESRMWGVKPKQDHEVEDRTKEELGEFMSEDPNVKQMGEATGTTIRQAEEFPLDEDKLKANEARLAKWANKVKQKQRKKKIIIFGSLLVVGGIVAGTAIFLSGGDGDEEKNAGINALPTLSPTTSPSFSPSISPTPTPFRVLDLAGQEALCEAIKESDEFNFGDSDQVAVYISCQDNDNDSIFACTGDGELAELDNFCFGVNRGVCPCDPGQIINATDFEGGFSDICVEEIDPQNERCVELDGDLAGLLDAAPAAVVEPY